MQVNRPVFEDLAKLHPEDALMAMATTSVDYFNDMMKLKEINEGGWWSSLHVADRMIRNAVCTSCIPFELNLIEELDSELANNLRGIFDQRSNHGLKEEGEEGNECICVSYMNEKLLSIKGWGG